MMTKKDLVFVSLAVMFVAISIAWICFTGKFVL